MKYRWIGVACALLLSAGRGALAQPAPQVNENCTVSVLNRTVTANANGTWILPNVPANFGPVRARVTCVVNGQTISGESDSFLVPANGIVNIPAIHFGQTTPIPTALTIAQPPTLTQAGQTVQLSVTAHYSDGSTKDVTPATAGTTYTVSNPAFATITSDGLMQAVSSGVVIVQASHEGASGMTSVRVAFGGGSDADGDGIPDADEVLLGLNPNDAVDAMEDFDRDNLTNLQEYQLGTDIRKADWDGDGLRDGDEVTRGTNPFVPDTDGDGVSDGLEVQTGSDPLDPSSINLPGALSRISIVPEAFTLTFNTIASDVSVALRVTGTLRDGGTLDLTSTQRGTNYSSSDLTICNLNATPGRVFAGQAGSCVITATVAGFSATSNGTVHTFSPTSLSSVALPGPGYGVDVSGNAVYVATGGGLQVVNVSDRAAPFAAAFLPLAGTAVDVKVDGTRAYVAASAAGLHIVDISNPFTPSLLGSIDTPGSANDVRVRAGVAYVADGDGGLQIIDVSDASQPRIIGVAPTGPALGVDLTDSLAVVAQGGLGIKTVGIANPSVPVILGSVATSNALDVVANGDFAYVADYTGSLRAVDLRNPAAPVLGGFTSGNLGGYLYDVARADSFVFGADVFFVNGVPIVDVSDAYNLRPRAILNFPGDATGIGIAVDGSYVYLGTDTGRLYIGQYRIQEDLNGIPPTVSLRSPTTGTTFVHGEAIPVAVDASDDLAVVEVALQVDGLTVARDTTAPYHFNLVAPNQNGSMSLAATAIDLGNNVGASGGVVLSIIDDPLTIIEGRVLSTGTPFAGATVACNSVSTTTAADGMFALVAVPTVPRMTGCTIAGVNADGTLLRGLAAASLVRGGVTNLGDIAIAPLPIILSIAPAVFDATRPPATLRITGANLLGAAFEFDGDIGQTITVGEPQVNPSGTEAVFPITVAATAHGRFTLIGTNQFGGADPSPTAGNTVTVLNAQDDVDTDGDGFADGLELLLGSDPASSLSIPLTTAREGIVQFSVLNSAFPFEVQRSAIQWLSVLNTSFPFGVEHSAVQWFSVSNRTFPEAVQRSSTQWFSVLNTFVPLQPQTLVGPTVSVRNDPAALLQSRLNQNPTVSLSGIDSGRRLIEGETFTFTANVSGPDGGVVDFMVNGELFATATSAPYEMLFTVPAGVPELTFAATGRWGDTRTALAPPIVVSVTPDAGTTVAGRVVNATGQPVANALVEILSSGLRAQYFESAKPLSSLPDITKMTATRSTRVTALNTRDPRGVFGADPLGTSLTPDYAARFSGWLSVAVAGNYRFFLGADEGAKLTIAGRTLVDLSTPVAAGFQESSGAVTLPVGIVPIEVTFYQSTGNAELQLSVVPPGGTRQVVAPSALVPASAPFTVRTDSAGRFRIRGVPVASDNVRIVVTPPTTANGGVILPVSGRIPATGIDVGDLPLPRRP